MPVPILPNDGSHINPSVHGMRVRQHFEQSFLGKLDKTDTCWLWHAAVNNRGYGVFKGYMAHRISYEMWVADLPAELVIDHTCRVLLCVNPAHLEAVTNQENCRRGVKWKSGRYFVDDHDHEASRNARGQCTICNRDYMRRKRAELRSRTSGSQLTDG